MSRYRLVVPLSVQDKLLSMGRVGLALAEFMHGPLLDNPWRVGKPLAEPLAGQHSARRGEYRILYIIDNAAMTVTVTAAGHRRHIYKPR